MYANRAKVCEFAAVNFTAFFSMHRNPFFYFSLSQ